jgi:fumarylacetoacetate (FAA) hydrolase
VPSFRDFSAFEGHNRNGVAAAAKLLPPGSPPPEVPAYWFEMPGFYFSNPAAFRGPDQPVSRPAGCEWLDLELEIGGIVGANGELAGFMLLNDWSARDIQMRESAMRLGPHKAKDFCTSIGPWFVTPDELPYVDGRLHLNAQVRINGEVLSECYAAEQHYTWPELLAHAERDTALRTGDLIASGTLTNGCLMEFGGDRWLEPGDVVELHCDQLGTLRSRIV